MSTNFKYDAFISYPRNPDREIALSIQNGLRKLGAKKHLLQFRALDIFRDESHFSGNTSLKSKIEYGLSNSEYLIILASPEISHSSNNTQKNWIEEEIKFWIAHKGFDPQKTKTLNIIICITRGTIAWDYERNDFDWKKTNALPPILKGKFAEEPTWIDFSSFETNSKLNKQDVFSLENPTFKQKIAEVSSQIQNVTVDQIIGEDIRRKRLWKFLLSFSIIILIASISLTVFLQQRAIKNLELANANHLATLSIQISADDSTRALMIAKEAYDNAPFSQAQKALMHCFYKPIERGERFFKNHLKVGNIARTLHFLGNTSNFLGHTDGSSVLKIYNTDGSIIKSQELNFPISLLSASPDGEKIAAITTDVNSNTSRKALFHLWNVKENKVNTHNCSYSYSLDDKILFSKDADKVSWSSENTLFLYDTQKKVLDSLQLKKPVQNFRFLEELSCLVIVSGSSLEGNFKIQVYDYALEKTDEFIPKEGVYDFDISDDQKLLGYTHGTSITLLSLPELNLVHSWSDEHSSTKIKFLSNNNLVEYNGWFNIYDTNGNLLYNEEIDGPTYYLDVSPKGKYIYHSDFIGNMLVKSVVGKNLLKIKEPATIFSASMDELEKFLVTGSDEGSIHLYNLEQYTPASMVVDTVDTDAINEILYRTKNKETITVSSDGNISIWNSNHTKVREATIPDLLSKAQLLEKSNTLLIGGNKGLYFMDLTSTEIKDDNTIDTDSEILGFVLNKDKEKWIAMNSSGEIASNYFKDTSFQQVVSDTYIWDVALDENERTLYLCSDDSNLYTVKIDSFPTITEKINLESNVKKVTQKNGNTLIRTDDYLWFTSDEISQKNLVKIFSNTDESLLITDAALLDDGKTVIFTMSDHKCYKISTDGEILLDKPIFNYPWKIIVSPKQTYVAVLTLEGNVFLMDKNFELIYKFSFLDYSDTANTGFFNTDETELTVASWAGLAFVWKTPLGLKKLIDENQNEFYRLTQKERRNYGLID